MIIIYLSTIFCLSVAETDDALTSTSSLSSSSCQYLIGFLPVLSFNRGGHSKHFVGAVEYALRRANDDLMRSQATCSLVYRTIDNKADTLESLRAMTQLYIEGAVAFIGPEDTCATEARLAAAWNLPMIAFVSITQCVSLFITAVMYN